MTRTTVISHTELGKHLSVPLPMIGRYVDASSITLPPLKDHGLLSLDESKGLRSPRISLHEIVAIQLATAANSHSFPHVRGLKQGQRQPFHGRIDY
jgi:hypothetical protein